MVKESFELWTKTLVLIAATKEGRWRSQKVLWYLVSPRSPSSYIDFFPLSNTFTVFQRDEVTSLMLLWIMAGFQEQSGSSFLRRTTCSKPFPWNFRTKVLFFVEAWRRVFNSLNRRRLIATLTLDTLNILRVFTCKRHGDITEAFDFG